MLTETIELDDVKMIPELIKIGEDCKNCNIAKTIEWVKGVFLK